MAHGYLLTCHAIDTPFTKVVEGYYFQPNCGMNAENFIESLYSN